MTSSAGKWHSFVSHADPKFARTFTRWLQRACDERFRFFLSADSFLMGDEWFHRLKRELAKSQITFFLLTPQSYNRPWIVYEWAYTHGLMHKKSGEKRKVLLLSFGLPVGHLDVMYQSHYVKELFDEKTATDFTAKLFQELKITDKTNAVVQKFGRDLWKLSEKYLRTPEARPPVRPWEHGITGVFRGTIGGDQQSLRSLEQCKKMMIVAGPSLSAPLQDENLLRKQLVGALERGVDVYVFLGNPVLRFTGGSIPVVSEDQRASAVIKDIYLNYPGSNTCSALEALHSIIKDLAGRPVGTAKCGVLRVYLVNYDHLDFAIMCDGATILCRSTIYWPKDKPTQKVINGAKGHDYKPPILEVEKCNTADSFYGEYRNYLESLACSARIPGVGSSLRPDLAEKVFPVIDITDSVTSELPA